MKNCRYFMGGILLCLAFYGQPILAEGKDGKSTSTEKTCLIGGLFDASPCSLDIAVVAGGAYSNTAGGGQAASVSSNAISLTAFETDKTSGIWNIGFGFYGQPVYKRGGIAVNFDAHLGYGKSYILNELMEQDLITMEQNSAGMGKRETSLKKYFGLNASYTFNLIK